MAIEEALVDINKTLRVPSLAAADHIKMLPKMQEMEDLQARMNYLVKENGELKGQLVTKEAEQKQMGELKGRIAALKDELVEAQKQENNVRVVARNFEEFIGNPGDVVNKAKLYDKGMSWLGASPTPKIIRFLVDYNIKMEKVLAEIRAIYQDCPEQQHVQAQEQPVTPTSTSQVEPQPDSQVSDPTLQEAIPDLSFNTGDMEELAIGGLQEMATPRTESQQQANAVQQATSGSVTRSKARNQRGTPLSIF